MPLTENGWPCALSTCQSVRGRVQMCTCGRWIGRTTILHARSAWQVSDAAPNAQLEIATDNDGRLWRAWRAGGPAA